MTNLLIVAFHELSRFFRTRRGWLTIIGFTLIWTTLLLTVVRQASDFMTSEQTGSIADALLHYFGLDALNNWAAPEVAAYWLIALYLLPMFCLPIAADLFASDRARGTLRFVALRSSRSKIFFGRLIGQWLIQLVIVTASFFSVIILIGFRSPTQAIPAFTQAPIVIINLMLILTPVILMMGCVSIIARSARQATLLAVSVWLVSAIAISWIQYKVGSVPVLDWALPGSQIPSLLQLSGWDTLQLANIPITQSFILLLLGWWVAHRIAI